MEQVVRNYGRFFICCVVLVAVLWLFWGKGDSAETRWSVREEVAAEFMPQESTAEDKDFLVLNEEGACAAPQIVWKHTGALEAGTTYAIEELAEARDYAGTGLVVQVRWMKGEGEAGDALLEDEGRSVHFVRPGIYTLQLSAADEERRRVFCEIRVPVNGN